MNANTTLSRRRQAPVAEGETPNTVEPENETETENVEPQHDIPNRTMRRVQAGHTGADLLKLASRENRLGEKSKLMTSTAQLLAELVDIQGEDEEVKGRAADISNNVAYEFYKGMSSGLLSLEETKEILGNQFGWRKKGSPKERATKISEQTTTPFAYGTTILQRVQRFVKANAYADDPSTGDNFFKDLDPDYVASVLDKVDAGEISIFTGYDQLQKIRSAARQDNGAGPVDLAFDVKKLAKIIGKLSEAGTPDYVANADNKGLLVVAYAELRGAIEALTDALMGREDAEDIVEAVQSAPVLEIA